MKCILKHESILGFYRGYLVTLVREIPFSIIQFPLWEYLKLQMKLRKNKEKLSFLESGSCGAISGALAASSTTPIGNFFV